MIKIRVTDNQIEIYSDNKIIELVQGALTAQESGRIVSDWFYGKTMKVTMMRYCTWYYEQDADLELTEYAKGGIINA